MKRKFNYVYQSLMGELIGIQRTLVEIEKSGEFFKELFKAYMGTSVEEFLSLTKRRVKQARAIYQSVVREFNELSESDPRSAEVFKVGAGRLLSLYKRINRKLLLFNDYIREISKMPDIRGEYVIVIAGLPQVGKSTLLSKLTSAKPVIGTYPFTTKKLIAGHINVEPFGKIVLVDSPGILDTPIEEKNLIEYKAILAIKFLADHVLYLFTMYNGFYYSLMEQVNVYNYVKRIVGNKPITVVLSKVDLMNEEQMQLLISEVEKYTGIKPIPVSALTGFNLNELGGILVKHFMEKVQRL